MNFYANTITGNISFNDSPFRDEPNQFYSNTFNGNFSITTNSANPSASTSMSLVDVDSVTGQASFIINADIPFTIGNPAHKFILSGDLAVNSDFDGNPALNNIQFIKTSAPTRTGPAYNAQFSFS
jgi:hypothetical protein